MRPPLVHLAFGVLFGAVLAASGAADFEAMRRMLRFERAHLFVLAAVTTGVAAVGFLLLRRWRNRSLLGQPIKWTKRPLHRASIPGALVFGLGWALSGSCPGTALVQVGMGQLVALATVAGVIVGLVLYRAVNERLFGLPSSSCE